MTPETASPKYPQRDPDLFYELARDRLNTQLSMLSAVDDKIGLLVSLGSALLGIHAAVLAVSGALGAVDIVFLILALGAYAFVAFPGFEAYRARYWSVGAKLDRVWADLWTEADDATLKWRVANTTWAYYRQNQAAHEAKGGALRMVFIAVLLQTLLVVLALALVGAGV